MDILADTVSGVKKNFDIDNDAVDLAIEQAYNLPRRLRWAHWVPNGILLSWKELSERERCLIISTAYRAYWQWQDDYRRVAE